MDLQRIYVDKRNDKYLVVAKISELSNQYICLNTSLSTQKINTGDNILALTVKNIEQFKGGRPFVIKTETEIFKDIEVYGFRENDNNFKLFTGDLVRFNMRKFLMVGVIVNIYAQWNMPTPLLFDTFDLISDYRNLFNSRLSDDQINDKINDNFQAGKYDTQMTIPLLDVDKNNSELTIAEKAPSAEEIVFMYDRYEAEKDRVFVAKKDVFIDSMLKGREKEISDIRNENPELYKTVQNLLISVNKVVNDRISGVDKKKTIPVSKAKKEEKETEEDVDLSFLNDVDDVLNLDFLDDLDNII